MMSFPSGREIYQTLIDLSGVKSRTGKIILAFVVFLWLYFFWAPVSLPVLPLLDATTGTLALLFLGCTLHLARILRRQGTRSKPGFDVSVEKTRKWPFIIVLVATTLAIFMLVDRFYWPKLGADQRVLVSDIRDISGKDLTPAILTELNQRLQNDPCPLPRRAQRIATPLPSFTGKSLLERRLRQVQVAVIVFGEPFATSHNICSAWFYKDDPKVIYAEWPGVERKTAFDVNYCTRIGVDDADNLEDVLSEVLWKIHILTAIETYRQSGNTFEADIVATHASQEESDKRVFRSIVSYQISGMIFYNAALNKIPNDPCSAAENLAISITKLNRAVALNTMVEKEILSSMKGPGWRQMYNHQNMAMVKYTLFNAIAQRSNQEKQCQAQKRH